MVTRLQVTYRSPEVDVELDKKILEFFNSLDFVCTDRLYHSILFQRDIFFERQGEETNGSRSEKAELKA